MKVKCTEATTRFVAQKKSILYVYTFEFVDFSKGYATTDLKIYSEQALNHEAGKDYNLSID